MPRTFTPDAALAQVRYACARKRPYRSLTEARGAAAYFVRFNGLDGERLVAYRCPADPSHSHFGHPPSLDDMEMIALAIRARTGCAPAQNLRLGT